MEVPKDLLYTKTHEWVQTRADSTLRVGITHHAQQALGDVVYLDILSKGESIQKEQVFGTVEAVKAVSDLLMPVSGKVIAVNDALEQQPELVNRAPYGEGWMIEILPSNGEELKELLPADAYKKTIAQ